MPVVAPGGRAEVADEQAEDVGDGDLAGGEVGVVKFFAPDYRAMADVEVVGGVGTQAGGMPVVGEDFPVVGVQYPVSVAFFRHCPLGRGNFGLDYAVILPENQPYPGCSDNPDGASLVQREIVRSFRYVVTTFHGSDGVGHTGYG